MTRDELKKMTRDRLLSGQEFTTQGLTLAGELSNGGRDTLNDGGDVMRVVDGEVQRLRKAGLIQYRRDGRRTIWKAVTA